jgi:soluble lytic murein transglycosylase-like protein
VVGAVLVASLAAGCTPGSFAGLAAPSLTVAAASPVATRIQKPDATLVLAYAAARAPSHGSLDPLIAQAALRHGIPESLIHRVIDRESDYNPRARNGAYWGLMQISLPTARSMGYKGSGEGLLDAATNLEYAGKYLRGAYISGGRSESRAMQLYASGFYYVARDKGLLEEVGLR